MVGGGLPPFRSTTRARRIGRERFQGHQGGGGGENGGWLRLAVRSTGAQSRECVARMQRAAGGRPILIPLLWSADSRPAISPLRPRASPRDKRLNAAYPPQACGQFDERFGSGGAGFAGPTQPGAGDLSLATRPNHPLADGADGGTDTPRATPAPPEL
ncbi:MAG: hypothetical protein ACK56I_09190, partial [bacterium]